MIAPVQYDLNVKNFLNKGQENKHFLIQIAEYYQKYNKKNNFIMMIVR